MNYILILIVSSFAYAKTLNMKDLAISSDVSDIKPSKQMPIVVKNKIDLGSDPLNLSPQKSYAPATNYRKMLSHDQLLKSEPTPQSVGRHIPGYGPSL